MREAFQDTLIWVMGWFLDRSPSADEAFRLLYLAALGGIAALLVLYWKNLACRLPPLRRWLKTEDRYARRYLQALWRNGEVRYSLITIFYNAWSGRYEVAGHTYSPEGRELGAFKSRLVRFPSGNDARIEFIWGAGNASRGYTLMTLEDAREDYIQGAGHIITFDAWPRAYPVRFKLLNDRHVRRALGVRSPVRPKQAPAFIQKFHAAFGADVLEGFGGRQKVKTSPRDEPVASLPVPYTGQHPIRV